MPERIKVVAPVIPLELQKSVRGVVAVELVISPSGDVADVRVIRSVPEVDDLVVAAVRQWKYTPTTFAGKPAWVKVVATVQIADPGTVPVLAAPPVGKRSCDECGPGEHRILVELDLGAVSSSNAGSCTIPPSQVVNSATEIVDSAIKTDFRLSERPFSLSDKESVILGLAHNRKATSIVNLLTYSSSGRSRCTVIGVHLPKTTVISRVRFATDNGRGELRTCAKGTDCGTAGRFVADTPFIVPTAAGHLVYSAYATQLAQPQRVQLIVYYKRLL